MKNSRFLPLLFAVVILAGCEPYPYKQGKFLYTKFCENCHMADGSGLKELKIGRAHV